MLNAIMLSGVMLSVTTIQKWPTFVYVLHWPQKFSKFFNKFKINLQNSKSFYSFQKLSLSNLWLKAKILGRPSVVTSQCFERILRPPALSWYACSCLNKINSFSSEDESEGGGIVTSQLYDIQNSSKIERVGL